VTSPIIDSAAALAARAHGGQVDKAGDPYIGHPHRVAQHLRTGQSVPDYVVAAALLHDVVEDTDVTVADIDREFGPDVAALVAALTHRPFETRADYLTRVVAAGPYAVAIKRADVADNSDEGRLSRLDEATAERLRGKYAATLAALDTPE